MSWCQCTEYREPTSGLEPLSCSLRVIIQALQGFARACRYRMPKLLSFLSLTPYCDPGGVRVVSISSSYSPDTIVRQRPARFNLWKKEGQGFHRADPSMKLRSPRPLQLAPGGPLVHVDLLAAYVFLHRSGVLYYPS
jgi:hypothetical protein